MTVLNSKKILQEENTRDPNSITALNLTHKALSDVSCLTEFKNLERLDLGFNNLTSLEGLKSCANLKWLSVAQNKLQSLKGIEGLTKLNVLNAGKNKLKSMDEVKSLVNLRALILNENEISSVCKLDRMKELNTLVLSRNPIKSLGESLIRVKSLTKLSLANCQLQSVDLSLKSCTELKELRLAHNEIKTVPSEVGRLVKLQNLDMGNNLITSRSNLKVLSSLVNLRNLNLKGNPISEKANLLRKVNNLLPNLQIFNARPINKINAKEVHEKDNDFSVETGDKLTLQSESKADHSFKDKNSKKDHLLSGSADSHINNTVDLSSKKKRKELLDEKSVDSAENANVSEKRMKKKMKLQQIAGRITYDTETLNVNPKEQKKPKHKKQETNQLDKERGDNKLGGVIISKGPDKKLLKKIKGDDVNIIDSAEIPFMDLFATGAPEAPLRTADRKIGHKNDQKIDSISELVTLPKKREKRNLVNPAALELSQVDDIGLGGPSAWDDI